MPMVLLQRVGPGKKESVATSRFTALCATVNQHFAKLGFLELVFWVLRIVLQECLQCFLESKFRPNASSGSFHEQSAL